MVCGAMLAVVRVEEFGPHVVAFIPEPVCTATEENSKNGHNYLRSVVMRGGPVAL